MNQMSAFDKWRPKHIDTKPTTDEAAVAHAVLFEIQGLIQKLLDEGRSGAIDFQSLPPMGPAAYDFLKRWLSVGEVTATVAGLGRTEIRETHYPGVWWLTHRNDSDEIVQESVEVTEIPEILRSHREDIRSGLRTMSEHLLATWHVKGNRV